jgi:hypothetical protein
VSQLRFEVIEFGGSDDLNTRETRAVAELEEGDALRMTRSPHPPAKRHEPARGLSLEDLPYGLAIGICGFVAHRLEF